MAHHLRHTGVAMQRDKALYALVNLFAVCPSSSRRCTCTCTVSSLSSGFAFMPPGKLGVVRGHVWSVGMVFHDLKLFFGKRGRVAKCGAARYDRK